MAYIGDNNRGGVGYYFNITVMDKNMDTVNLDYALRATNDLEADLEAAAILTAFDAVSLAVVVGYSIGQRFVNDSIGIPTAGEVQIKARLSFQEKDSFHKGTFDIPAPKETIFLATTGKMNNVVDVANSDVTDYADLFRAAGVAYVNGGESLEYLLEGRKVSSRSGLRSR